LSTTTGQPLKKMPLKEVLTYALSSDRVLAAAFAGETVDDIWAAVEARRAGVNQAPSSDVRGPEWTALTSASGGLTSIHFEAELIAPPPSFATRLAGVTLVHRLRVVTALCGSRASAPASRTMDVAWHPSKANVHRAGYPWLKTGERASSSVSTRRPSKSGRATLSTMYSSRRCDAAP
jgi:hypothetical protein